MLTDFAFRRLGRFPALQRQFKRVVLHLPARRREVEHWGQHLIVDPTELSGYYLYYERAYDAEVFHLLSEVVQGYSQVLDVGANIGVYTVFFAARVPRVDAFEPMPAVAATLRENIRLNGLTNVAIHEVCVGSAKGTVRFSQPTRANSGIGHIAFEGGDLVRDCIGLDDFLGGSVTEPTLIKMDIEGAEWLALSKKPDFLRKRRAQLAILLELHPEEIKHYGGSVEALLGLLVEAGLRVKTISNAGLADFSLNNPHRFLWVVGSANP